jgi:GNAT superfamily N-acetyltransferase
VQVQIRPFRLADLGSVRQLIDDTIRASYSAVYPPRAIQHFLAYHSASRILDRHGAGDVLVVAQEGVLVATGSVVADEIVGVFVSPDCQRSGVGAYVMDELEAVAQAGGFASTRLSASLPSVGFYERRGYRMLEARSIDVGEGQRLDYWVAQKDLAGT